MTKELVHGLTKTVKLADWDFAIIQAALKYYARNHPQSRAYCKQLQAKLRRPFASLVKDTKRLHASLKAAQTAKKVTDYT